MSLSAGASIVVVMAALTAGLSASEPEPQPPLVTREEWGARPPKERQLIAQPLDTVVIHHSYIPGACPDRARCVQAMRDMQNFHMDDRGWADIGYNFAVGGDAVYEGRGWMVVGAHSPGYNNHSVGVCFIGDYTEELPTESMLKNALALIESGVKIGHIRADYQLIGHRQSRATECPGDRLYQLIQTWDHWTATPTPSTGPRTTSTPCLETVSREQWGARPAEQLAPVTRPLDTVVIHHSHTPGACADRAQCAQAMRQMQNQHMDDRKWGDIGYNFAVGGDAVYEGRGWTVVGENSTGYNHSLSICFIGDYRDQLPSDPMLMKALTLIDCGVKQGHITPDYQLIGHRQASSTECPGDSLYQLMQTWAHWPSTPESSTTPSNTVEESTEHSREATDPPSINVAESNNQEALKSSLQQTKVKQQEPTPLLETNEVENSLSKS